MPLLLLIPLLVIGLFALWVVLLPVSIFQRYRFGKARRRVQPLFVRANAWLLAVCCWATRWPRLGDSAAASRGCRPRRVGFRQVNVAC